MVRQRASTQGFCSDTLRDSHQDLHKAIDQWCIRYRQLFPQVFPHITTDYPENDTLELPSSYKKGHADSFGLGAFSQFEYEIRLGHAYDSIDDIRSAIHIYNAAIHEKQTQVFGQWPGTRAWQILTSLRNDTCGCAK